MYIAMNRFRVKLDSTDDFETVWRTRDSHLADVPGFVKFDLLKGPVHDDEGICLYASHTIWASEQHFIDWTHSDHFKQAHKNAGQNKPLYTGHPQFEGFHVVLSE